MSAQKFSFRIEVEAMSWDGTESRAKEITDWIFQHEGDATYYEAGEYDDAAGIHVLAPDGLVVANVGDWVVMTTHEHYEFTVWSSDAFAAEFTPVVNA